MKASQLIMALAEGIKEHGDCDVECVNIAGDLDDVEGVNWVWRCSKGLFEVTTDVSR